MTFTLKPVAQEQVGIAKRVYGSGGRVRSSTNLAISGSPMESESRCEEDEPESKEYMNVKHDVHAGSVCTCF